MTKERELEQKFWKALKDDRVVMLGLQSGADGHAQPMTAQLLGKEEHGPIYIFTSKDTDLARTLGAGAPAFLHFAAKGHDLFATASGRLTPSNDRALIDELWSPFVAAWFKSGKDDPLLQLIRFDADEAQIWLNENSLFAGVKLMLGADPKKDFADKVVETPLH